MRRVACIALPQIRIEIAREDPATGQGPLAIIVARAGGSLKLERDVLGNTRLDVVSKEARALGVHVGQTVAAARAKCSSLRVRVVAELAVRTALARVAEMALAFGPSTAFDVESDVVWVEVGGCAHLHGGELELARMLDERVRSLGHVCRVSIADGPRIASAVARFKPSTDSGPLIVPEGKGAAAIRGLPIEALELEDETLVWMRDLGLQTCEDLQALPKRSLGMRLGARTRERTRERARDVLQLLNGEDCAPLEVWRPPEVPEERIELEWGASSVEALGFVAKALCDRLAARLEGRALSAARIVIVLTLDRALLAEGASPLLSVDLTLPVPIAVAPELFAVVRARLDRLDLPAPVLAVTVRAFELSAARARPLDLFAAEPKAARSLPPLVAELVADLGPSSVGTLALVDTWSPDERTRLAPFVQMVRHSATASPFIGLAAHTAAGQATGTAPLEPSRIVPPFAKALESFEAPVLLARFDGVEWWRRGMQRRDFCAAWDGSALAWLEVRTPGSSLSEARSMKRPQAETVQAWLRGWID